MADFVESEAEESEDEIINRKRKPMIDDDDEDEDEEEDGEIDYKLLIFYSLCQFFRIVKQIYPIR